MGNFCVPSRRHDSKRIAPFSDEATAHRRSRPTASELADERRISAGKSKEVALRFVSALEHLEAVVARLKERRRWLGSGRGFGPQDPSSARGEAKSWFNHLQAERSVVDAQRRSRNVCDDRADELGEAKQSTMARIRKAGEKTCRHFPSRGRRCSEPLLVLGSWGRPSAQANGYGEHVGEQGGACESRAEEENTKSAARRVVQQRSGACSG